MTVKRTACQLQSSSVLPYYLFYYHLDKTSSCCSKIVLSILAIWKNADLRHIFFYTVYKLNLSKVSLDVKSHNYIGFVHVH